MKTCLTLLLCIFFAADILGTDTIAEEVTRDGEYIDIAIYADSDPLRLVELSCRDNIFESCKQYVLSAVMLEKSRLFGHPLQDWSYSDICRCHMPPREKKAALQHLHIPKTGTSFNFILHDYFNCSVDPTSSQGCREWLESPQRLQRGLCGGRLFSCQGHRTFPDLPQRVFRGNTNLVTFMRDPWKRAISDYNYIMNNPNAKHLSPEQNLTALFPVNVFTYLMSPGIPNCATKMLNGFQCGENVPLSVDHLDTAKQVLTKILFVGITDYFRESVCLFTWLYGGTVQSFHYQKSRVTNYSTATGIDEILTLSQKQAFLHVYRYDIELYEFALDLFKSRYEGTGCT